MSSTGRTPQGSSELARSAHPDDFYRTPRWAVESLLNKLDRLPGPILEPGCGDGGILEVLRDRYYGQVIGIELDQARATAAQNCVLNGVILCADYLTATVDDIRAAAPGYSRPRSAVCNPPYKLAEPFVRRTIGLVRPGGTSWFLLRIAFLSGQARARSGLWEHLREVLVLPKRPSFTGRGTDSSDYAWMGFSGAETGQALLRHLPIPEKT